MLRLTRHGTREMVIGSILLAAAAVGLGLIAWPLALLVLPLWIFLLAFFRDPERTLPPEQDAMVSPADGTVSDIVELPNEPLLGGAATRVGIFLSIFSVHINRAPCDGRITAVQYKKGRFINAMSHRRASEENESNTLVISDSDGRPVAVVKQIVGVIARRIICTANLGDLVQRGQRIGMIKFGSRTELYIPAALEPQLAVYVGQAVHGAADVIAVLRKPVHSSLASAESGQRQPASAPQSQ